MHIDRPAIVGPERLVLRTSAALYVDDLKAVGEFTVDSGQSVPPRHGRLPSVGLAFLEGKPMSAKGRLARRISSIASFSAGTSADMAFMAARARASGKVESGVLTGAGLHGSLGLEKGDLPYIGPAHEGEC
jgi:hypothetical protein